MTRLLVVMTIGASTTLISECFRMCNNKTGEHFTEIVGVGSIVSIGLTVVKDVIIGVRI